MIDHWQSECGRVQLLTGDCLAAMAGMDAESVDAIVTDPPYGLSFMGKDWDHGVPGEPFWAEALRVAKPGAHILAFGGTRTHHRLACAIEDAGWEIRDVLMWVYGSGFPKSHNLAGEWDGWGTALKPAWEPIVLARKPLIGTVAKNLAAHRTGALNIDGCRVEFAGEADREKAHDNALGPVERSKTRKQIFDGGRANGGFADTHSPKGRWPANLCHDGSPEVLAGFPNSLSTGGGGRHEAGADTRNGIYGTYGSRDLPRNVGLGDSGSAARFFYCPKASKADREDGLEFIALKETRLAYGETGQGPSPQQTPRTTVLRSNTHPTVKPTDLMRYLCRLVTPPGGLVMDPFNGSGSTGKAAVLEGFRYVGIDLMPEYVAISRCRIERELAQGRLAV